VMRGGENGGVGGTVGAGDGSGADRVVERERIAGVIAIPDRIDAIAYRKISTPGGKGLG
jgi:hypothetical protein